MIKIVESNKSKSIGESLKDFTSSDYYGYDAMDLPGGKKPKIYRGDTVDVVVSGSGSNSVEVMVDAGHTEYFKVFRDESSATKVAKEIIAELKSGMSPNGVADKYKMRSL